MRALGIFLIIFSLMAGALSAATAYHVPLTLPDEYFKEADKFGHEHDLTLKAEAGAVVQPDGTLKPLAKPKDKLTPPLLQQLREQAAHSDPDIRRHYVIVQEFSFARWPGKWWFLAALAGLLSGGLLLRSATQKAIAAARGSQQAEGPEAALAAVKNILEELRRALGRTAGPAEPGKISGDIDERLKLIIIRLSDVQKTHLAAFVEARPLLIARHGLVGFAEIMDRFAACERQINRAWSAAADGVYEESVECLDLAAELLDETLARLRNSTGQRP